jgi:AhpD family alkylhydroperoxidase
MTSVKVFDPAMCCSTGVCGPSVDPDLVRFAGDLDWLAGQGAAVERFNLSQQPDAFVAYPVVTRALQERGEAALPLILVDERKVSEGTYPSRDRLAQWAGVSRSAGLEYTPAVDELVAVGAAIASNCEPCLEYHVDRARKLGVGDAAIRRAVDTAIRVKDTPARHIEGLAESLLPSKKRSVLQVTSAVPANSKGSEGCGCGEGACC